MTVRLSLTQRPHRTLTIISRMNSTSSPPQAAPNQPLGSTSPSAVPPTYSFEHGEYDWIEKAGIENLKGRVATADTLAKEAVTTLTVLLAGAGGSWAYAVKLLDQDATAGGFAAVVAGVWLTALAMALVLGCLRISPIPPVYNQPGKLLERPSYGWSLDQWRLAELRNIDERISRAVVRNNTLATRLNWIRGLATATPVLAGIGVWLFHRCN